MQDRKAQLFFMAATGMTIALGSVIDVQIRKAEEPRQEYKAPSTKYVGAFSGRWGTSSPKKPARPANYASLPDKQKAKYQKGKG